MLLRLKDEKHNGNSTNFILVAKNKDEKNLETQNCKIAIAVNFTWTILNKSMF